MAKKLNDRQRKFAQLVAGGMPAGRAYEQAGYSARGDSADAHAARLVGNGRVAAYIATLRAKATEKAESRLILSLIEKREFLARVVRTPIGQIDQNSPMCQEWTHDEVGGSRGKLMRGQEPGGNEKVEEEYVRIKVKMPCKLRALELDAKLAGEFTETLKIDPGDSLLSLLERIRASK